jgi:transposase
MSNLLPDLRFAVKQRLRTHWRRGRDAARTIRYRLLVNLSSGRSPPQTAATLPGHRRTAYRVAQRFARRGARGLLDRRADNGAVKLAEAYLATLDAVVRPGPREQGWRRPTWTRAMLVATLRRKTGVRLPVATRSRARALRRARRGRPRPTGGGPWPQGVKTRRLNALARLVAARPRRAVAAYADEVDSHPNPKVGLAWMVRGQPKEVLTPGQNEKRYLAGALDVGTGQLPWVAGAKKARELFVDRLVKLYHAYPRAEVIPVLLDNYRMPSSRSAGWARGCAGGRIQWHFRPPYGPKANRSERVWEDRPGNVTRNHCGSERKSRRREVRLWLQRYNRQAGKRNKPETA